MHCPRAQLPRSPRTGLPMLSDPMPSLPMCRAIAGGRRTCNQHGCKHWPIHAPSSRPAASRNGSRCSRTCSHCSRRKPSNAYLQRPCTRPAAAAAANAAGIRHRPQHRRPQAMQQPAAPVQLNLRPIQAQCRSRCSSGLCPAQPSSSDAGTTGNCGTTVPQPADAAGTAVAGNNSPCSRWPLSAQGQAAMPAADSCKRRAACLQPPAICCSATSRSSLPQAAPSRWRRLEHA